MNKYLSSVYKIRFSDCDLFGHLNNARYIDYFMNAREDHLSDHYQLSLNEFYQQGISWLVSGHQVSYIRPAVYNEKVVISSHLVQANAESLLVEMQMLDERQSRLKALLWTRFVPVNIKTGKKENHTGSFMQFAQSIVTNDFDIADGYEHRLSHVLDKIKREQMA